MTVGSWSTMATSYAGYSWNAGHMYVTNGTTVSWIGDDSPPRPVPRGLSRSERILYFAKDGYTPYQRGRFVREMDEKSTQEMARKRDIFDHAREKRLRLVEDWPGGLTPYSSNSWGRPHSFSKTWLKRQESVFTVWDQWSGYYPSSMGPGGFSPARADYPWTAEHDYRLLSRLRKKVVGSDFNLASFLGAEGLDTLAFLLSTANTINRVQLLARKGNVSAAIDILRRNGRYKPVTRSQKELALQKDVYSELVDALAGRQRWLPWAVVPPRKWLEYHLAIEPLVGDVKAAAEQLAHILMMERQKKIAVGVTAKATLPKGPNAVVYELNERIVRKSVKAYFTYPPDPINFTGFQDPEVTIWNAIPLSFVWDYMHNVGGFLEARATRAALPDALYVSTVKDEHIVRNLLGKMNNAGDGFVYQVQPDQGWAQGRRSGTITRSISTSLPVPTPPWRFSGVCQSWQRTLTALSLGVVLSVQKGDTPTHLLR